VVPGSILIHSLLVLWLRTAARIHGLFTSLAKPHNINQKLEVYTRKTSQNGFRLDLDFMTYRSLHPILHHKSKSNFYKSKFRSLHHFTKAIWTLSVSFSRRPFPKNHRNRRAPPGDRCSPQWAWHEVLATHAKNPVIQVLVTVLSMYFWMIYTTIFDTWTDISWIKHD